MQNFAAIDFETANQYPTSVCSVGVVVVRDGEITDKFYSLIRPEPEFYSYWNTRVHGIQKEDTLNAPVFPQVWEQIIPFIEGLPLIAHNKSFDEKCLKEVGLSGYEHRSYLSLSGGEKQRAGVARALYKHATYVFADEPTASLDSDNRHTVTQLLLQAAHGGACVVLATHDEELATRADTVYAL